MVIVVEDDRGGVVSVAVERAVSAEARVEPRSFRSGAVAGVEVVATLEGTPVEAGEFGANSTPAAQALAVITSQIITATLRIRRYSCFDILRA
ncbi:MAG: hypothetical protein O3B95_12495 [Chloroflexi bacterium]|nr:hypothetical protein [Chloroflexota bacterium]